MINENTILLMNGKSYSMRELMEKYDVPDMENMILIAKELVKEGHATIKAHSTKDENIIDNIKKKLAIDGVLETLDKEKEGYVQGKREEKLKEKDKVSFTLEFMSTPEAVKAEKWIQEMGIKTVDVILKSNEEGDTKKIQVKVTDATLDEYAVIARKYGTEKAIKSIVDNTDKALTSATNAVNYGATNVVAPIAKIAGKAGLNIARGLVDTGAKVGASLINNGAKAVEETQEDLACDTELLKARRQLQNAKDSTLGFFRRKINKKNGSGINML